MANFEFLKEKTEYALFASAAIEAEKVYVSAPAMCAVGSRKALELAVKWVYSADNTMQMPYKDNLQALIHEPTFRFAVDYNTWGKLPFIIKLGNLAVHTERSVQASDALASLQGLFEFIQWVDYCYGTDYEERQFEEAKIPTERVVVDTKKIKEQESLLGEKDAEIEALRQQIEQMSSQITAAKEQHLQETAEQNQTNVRMGVENTLSATDVTVEIEEVACEDALNTSDCVEKDENEWTSSRYDYENYVLYDPEDDAPDTNDDRIMMAKGGMHPYWSDGVFHMGTASYF